MDTLILESNEITSFQLLDYLDAPEYSHFLLILMEVAKVIINSEHN